MFTFYSINGSKKLDSESRRKKKDYEDRHKIMKEDEMFLKSYVTQ